MKRHKSEKQKEVASAVTAIDAVKLPVEAQPTVKIEPPAVKEGINPEAGDVTLKGKQAVVADVPKLEPASVAQTNGTPSTIAPSVTLKPAEVGEVKPPEAPKLEKGDVGVGLDRQLLDSVTSLINENRRTNESIAKLLELLKPLTMASEPNQPDVVMTEEGEIKTWIPTETDTKESFLARSKMTESEYKDWVVKTKPKLTKYFPQVAKFN